MRLLSLIAMLLLACSLSASAQLDVRVLETELVKRYCAGMKLQQYVLPDGTEVDCLSDTHAIEVEKSDSGWYDSLAQALHYSLWTKDIAEHPRDFGKFNSDISSPRRAGVILVCLRERSREDPNDFCTEHTAHLYRIVEEYLLPLTIWDCNYPVDLTLSDCQKIEGQR